MNQAAKTLMNEFSRNRIPYSVDTKGRVVTPNASKPDFVFEVSDENIVKARFEYSEELHRNMTLSIPEAIMIAKVRHNFVTTPNKAIEEIG